MTNILQYAHMHWQDNVIASAIWAIPGYFWGRHHVKKIHYKLDIQDNLTHQKLNEIHESIKGK